jgi:hypothetical protein
MFSSAFSVRTSTKGDGRRVQDRDCVTHNQRLEDILYLGEQWDDLIKAITF